MGWDQWFDWPDARLQLACVAAIISASGEIVFADPPAAAAPATKPQGSSSAPSAAAAEQIQALAQEKASRTPAQQKMDSHLVLALKKSRGEPPFDRHPALAADLDVRPDGRVLVDLDATVTAELLEHITRHGGEVVNQFPQMRAVRALVPLAQTEVLAARSDVKSIAPASQPETHISGNKPAAAVNIKGAGGKTDPATRPQGGPP